MRTATMTATIMIVEDDAALRELLILSLEANAFQTVAAANSRDALAGLQARHVDLLLLDLGLGTESGIDLLKAVRKLPEYETLPVILLTGCASRNIVLEVAQLGVQGYLLKHQFSRKDLTARIEQVLRNRESAFSTAVAHTPRLAAEEADEPRHEQSSPALADADPDDPVGAAAPAQPELETSQHDLLRSVKPIIARAQTLEQVDRCAELKALSPTVSQLMSITAEPDCSLEQIARVIKLDQAISLKILKIANSVLYGYGGSVETVTQALSRIGVSQVRQLVLSMAVIDNFHTSGLGEHFNTESFWEHSIATGLIAATIARFGGGGKHAIDLAFTVGLLHDVARMVFVEQLDDIYKRVLGTAARLQLPLEQVEARMLLISHSDVVDRLLNAWNFPKRLVHAIAMHHLPVEKILRLAPEPRAEVATLVLADRLAHALLLGSSGNNCQYPTDALAQALKLKADQIKFIEEQIPEQAVDMKHAMLQAASEPPHPDCCQRLLNKFQRPLRPLFVGANPALDGHRMLLERLGQSGDNRQPNVAFLHLANSRDRDVLFQTLREREAAERIKPLPIIVMSPAPDPRLKPLLAGRQFKFMPSTFTLSRLADTVNSLLISYEQ